MMNVFSSTNIIFYSIAFIIITVVVIIKVRPNGKQLLWPKLDDINKKIEIMKSRIDLLQEHKKELISDVNNIEIKNLYEQEQNIMIEIISYYDNYCANYLYLAFQYEIELLKTKNEKEINISSYITYLKNKINYICKGLIIYGKNNAEKTYESYNKIFNDIDVIKISLIKIQTKELIEKISPIEERNNIKNIKIGYDFSFLIEKSKEIEGEYDRFISECEIG